jgi:alpha-beta hydrolase superfamily lysophospholipase
VFGYNANRTGNGAVLDFQDVASQLVEGLRMRRTSPYEKDRPIIFLAHSLGGLIVKKVTIAALSGIQTKYLTKSRP